MNVFIGQDLRINLSYNQNLLKMAFARTCAQRGSLFAASVAEHILADVLINKYMKSLWNGYIQSVPYGGDLGWKEVMESTIKISHTIFNNNI